MKVQPVYRIAKKEYRTLPKAQVRLPKEKQDVERIKLLLLKWECQRLYKVCDRSGGIHSTSYDTLCEVNSQYFKLKAEIENE